MALLPHNTVYALLVLAFIEGINLRPLDFHHKTVRSFAPQSYVRL